MTQNQFLAEIIRLLGSRYEALWLALGGAPQTVDRFHPYPAAWFSYACRGRNAAPRNPPTRHRAGPHIGLYLEPCQSALDDDGEIQRDGNTAHIEFAVRIDLSALPRVLRVQDTAARAAAAVALRFRALGSTVAETACDYPYGARPQAAQVQVVRYRSEWFEDLDGLWICIRSSVPFPINPRVLPDPSNIASELLEVWDRYVEVVMFLSGVFAPNPLRLSRSEALIGFLGEYAISQRIGPGVTWMGWQNDHDFVTADGTIFHEVKASAEVLPEAPIFGAPEIRLALSCDRAGYQLHLVNLSADVDDVMANLESLVDDGDQNLGAESPSWIWMTRLLACLPRRLHSQVCSNADRVENLLREISDGAEVRRVDNPFASEPLSAFGAVIDRIVPARFGVVVS